MKFSQFLKEHLVFLDGGMGTLLQSQGLLPGEKPEEWNLSHPDVICKIHKAYFEAGSHVVSANTFGANSLKFEGEKLKEIIEAGVLCAKKARDEAKGTEEKFIALDIGPTGKLLQPLGDLSFEDAVLVFRETILIGAKCGVDLIFIETMNDSLETKAALLAAKESTDLPVLVSCAYGEDGKLMTGATPEAMVAMLEGMGADGIGANCSLGPKQLRGVAERLLSAASVPVLLKPNAGLPRSVDGKTVFDVTPEEFAEEVALLMKKGLRIAGGCCGTTPEYIQNLTQKAKGILPSPLLPKRETVISSYTHTITFGNDPILIGERINPTGKKRFKAALLERDLEYIFSEGIAQEEKGVHALDVNVGIPDIDESSLLKDAVTGLQGVLDLPLQIDTANPEAMENALRSYNGKALINSVNGKEESMAKIFPLMKKYGGVAVALTLDEKGIPSDAEGRVAIAKKILARAKDFGIDKKDLIFDTLAMTVSADKDAAMVTLEALRRIRKELDCHTILGVSNISFGLPARDVISSTFFALALESGLSAAIMNPHSVEMMKVYHAYRALKGLDENCASYMEAAEGFGQTVVANTPVATKKENFSSELASAIGKGRKEKAAELCRLLLQEEKPLSIVENHIIPALNQVGMGFEQKTVFLPQLLMSAEAAKSAFEEVKSALSTEKTEAKKSVVVLATVKGDIHDIGKNIVKLLLENYGFNVIDMGKDVSPEEILDETVKQKAPIVGLSALMTTTVPAMEETIALLREKAPWCKVMVGGAVLTPEYAQKIGADAYAKDAMEAVRQAENLI